MTKVSSKQQRVGLVGDLNRATDPVVAGCYLADLSCNTPECTCLCSTSEALRFGLCRYLRILTRLEGMDGSSEEVQAADSLLGWLRPHCHITGEPSEQVLDRPLTRVEYSVLLRAVDVVDQLVAERVACDRRLNRITVKEFEGQFAKRTAWATAVQDWATERLGTD